MRHVLRRNRGSLLLFEVSCGQDQVDIIDKVVRNRITQCAQFLTISIRIVSKAGVQELIRRTDIGRKLDGTAHAVDFGNTSLFQPGNDRLVVGRRKKGIDLLLVQVFSIFGASRGRHGAQLALEFVQVLVVQGNNEVDWRGGIGVSGFGPTTRGSRQLFMNRTQSRHEQIQEEPGAYEGANEHDNRPVC